MDECLYFEQGQLSWRELAGRVELTVSARDEKLGLCKAWIQGSGLPFSLGTLLPQGEWLYLRRNLPVETLRAQGCWPIERAGITVTHPFGAKGRQQWAPLPQPALRFPAESLFSRLLAGETRALLRESSESGEWQLAIPFHPAAQFPLCALFCLCEIRSIQGAQYAVFAFDREGTPQIPAS